MKLSDLNNVADEYKIGKGKSNFLKLEAGDNRVRIVSEYEVLARHWSGKNRSTLCVGKEKGCIFCADSTETEGKPTIKFLMYVIDRKDGEIKIAELGWTIMSAIKDLAEDDDYEYPQDELPPYDVNIKKTVNGSGTKPSDTEYNVIAARQNTPLTTEEMMKIAELKPITEIVASMKDKALKEYEEMGLVPETASKGGPVDMDTPPFPDDASANAGNGQF